jgi:hypothetical protein
MYINLDVEIPRVSNIRFIRYNSDFRLRMTLLKDDVYYFRNVYSIDLTSLGISPSTDMDYYYSLYKARKNITNLENEIQNNIYSNGLYAIHLSIFTTEPTQTQMDNMLEYYLNYVNHYDFDYTLKTLTITDLFLFTGHLIVWYVIIALIKKGVKKV